MLVTDSDLKKINNFIDLVNRIKNLAFISEIKKNNLSNFFDSKLSNGKPDEEYLRSFILDVRKLYMESEDTSFKKMIPVFLKYLNYKDKLELQNLQNEYEESLTIKFPAGVPAKTNKTIKNIIDDWLYGHYLHEDENKKATIDDLRKAKDFYKWIFIDNLANFVFYYADSLQRLAKKIIESEK